MTRTELTDEQIEACAVWMQEGRDSFFNQRSACCPYDGDSIAGRAWDQGWLQARHDDHEARACGIYA
jgi:hypothetical protein